MGKGFGLEVFPQTLPDSARLPTPEAHVNGVPVTQLRRQIPPWAAGALKMEDGFQKLPVAHLAGRSGGRMFRRLHRRFELFPDFRANDFTHGMFEHPQFQSASKTFVHTIIREQNLAGQQVRRALSPAPR